MNRRKFERFAEKHMLPLERLDNDSRYASFETEWAWRGYREATIDPVHLSEAADELYSAGYADAKSSRDYDPRGCREWQTVMDLLKGDPHEGYLKKKRLDLCMGDLTDDELANEMFLYDHRTGLSSMAYLTAAKERIRGLSRKLESHHVDLLKIHRVTACVAEVEPVTEDDHLTVKRVKQMAIMINQLSEQVLGESEARESIHQWREIGETDWMDCSEEWKNKCEDSPEHDTRTLYTHPPKQQRGVPCDAESEGGEAVAWTKWFDGKQELVERDAFLPEDAISHGWRPLVYADATPQPDKWMPCSERQADAINHALDVLSKHGDAFTSVGAMKVLEEMLSPAPPEQESGESEGTKSLSKRTSHHATD